MKKVVLGLGMLCLSQVANAADINCRGKVSWVMADHPSCGEYMAFKTEATGGKAGKWLCTKSHAAGEMAVTALTNDKIVEVYVEGSDVNTCDEIPHYREINYIIINP
ncbi:hypothetical protein ACFSJY_04425 [Thalassotalea euphylliae]|uniref:hypothetical protein n=1 Tax=Thalassotalea euphylliae TaxID=1655234 RepID=UPI003630C9F3